MNTFRSGLFWVLVAVAFGLVFGLGKSAPPRKPYTYEDYRADRKKSCVDSKGHHEWRGSMSLTLDQFCELQASIETKKVYCEENPEKC